ncbi:MAG TPA: hypothetical protein PKI32_08055, partial [Opitutales bacterium]|nr:hypothetical protein [Opitutales bacterium]
MNIHNLRIATCVAGICMVSSALPAVWITGVDIGSSVGTSISENTVGAPEQMLFSEGVESPVISSTKVLVSTEVASYDSDFIAFEGGWNERMNSY